MPSHPPQSRLRRIVTGHDAYGRSVVAIDGPPDPVLEFLPGAGFYEVWADGVGPDRVEGAAGLLPPAAGSKCRWFTVLPEPPQVTRGELATFYDGAFKAMAGHDVRPDTSRHPGMHKTDTLDYIIVIEGQVRLMLDAADRVLGPGDVVVQRATNHAWVCVGETPALLVAILIDRA